MVKNLSHEILQQAAKGSGIVEVLAGERCGTNDDGSRRAFALGKRPGFHTVKGGIYAAEIGEANLFAGVPLS